MSLKVIYIAHSSPCILLHEANSNVWHCNCASYEWTNESPWNISLYCILSEILLPSTFVDQNYRGAEVTRSPVVVIVEVSPLVISHHGENSAKRQEDVILMCWVTTVLVTLKVFPFGKFALYYKVDVLVLCLMNLEVKIPF